MGWTTPGGSSALDGDMHITDMLGPEIGTTTIEGLDRHTGEHVRTFATSESYLEPVQLFTAASGRILVNDSRGERHLGVYETATGTDLWRHPYQETPPAISADGTLLVYGQEVLRIADGTAYAPVRDHIFHMTPHNGWRCLSHVACEAVVSPYGAHLSPAPR